MRSTMTKKALLFVILCTRAPHRALSHLQRLSRSKLLIYNTIRLCSAVKTHWQ